MRLLLSKIIVIKKQICYSIIMNNKKYNKKHFAIKEWILKKIITVKILMIILNNHYNHFNFLPKNIKMKFKI